MDKRKNGIARVLDSLAMLVCLGIMLFGGIISAYSSPKEQSKFSGSYEVTISTNKGKMTVLLYDQTPLHRDNLVKMVESGFYDGLLFHRVISGFVIQTGDPDSRGAESGAKLGEGGAEHTIIPEVLPGLIHKRGVLAAAREGDDLNPDRLSSGSHFYITLKRTPHLDGAYTIYGELLKGEKTLDKIAKEAVDENDRPLEDVIIKTMTVKKLSKPRYSELF